MGRAVVGLSIKERRATRRMALHRCRARVRHCLWRLWVPTGPEFTAKVVNVGLGGLTLRGQQHYRPGEYVAVTMYQKGRRDEAGEGLTLHGRVAWCTAPGSGTRENVGVQFTGRPQAIRRRLTTWIARHKTLLS